MELQLLPDCRFLWQSGGIHTIVWTAIVAAACERCKVESEHSVCCVIREPCLPVVRFEEIKAHLA